MSFCIGLLVALTLVVGCTSQQELAFKAVSAVTPANRDCARHQAFNKRVKQGNVDLIFIGDSITHWWERAGKEVWDKYYGHRNAVNLGIAGDRTEHVLWRLDNGNIDGVSPKVAVVMIGTNNHPPRNTGEEIADGIIVICKKLRTKLPKTKILLLGIFPRGAKPNPMREELAKASGIASQVADGKMIHYLDIGDKFIEADGSISKEIMPDYLHLSAKGYRIWANGIEPKLIELMGELGQSRRSYYWY
ncbi:MAG: platelet-activating factor acetylhydrolase IB subunit [Planctomycetota bacterium]